MSRAEKYNHYFETFLSSTNEKPVLLREILSLVEQRSPKSLLEIGPGPGDISIPVAQKVSEYVAVEKNPKYVTTLNEAGLNVVLKTFPNTNIVNSFDLILASHVISFDEDVSAFVDAAWEHLNKGGDLVIITYRDIKNEWTRLMSQIGYPELEDIHSENFDRLIGSLAKLSGSNPEVKIIQKFVTTQTSEEMVNALAFVASDGNPEKAEEFETQSETIIPILEEKYKTEQGYSFPFNHHFVVATKTSKSAP